MKKTSGEKPPPASTDLEGWRSAVAENRLRSFRPEAIAAAFEDLGPNTDRNVRDALARQLNQIIVGILRPRVSLNRPDQGKDVIFRVHGQIFEALLKPSSADGKALRTAFGQTVIFRLKTALADELRVQTVPAPKLKSDRSEKRPARKPQPDDEPELVKLPSEEAPEAYDDERAAPGKRECDPALMDQVAALDHQIDSDRIVSRVLATIPTYKKRLAYYLYLHNVPAKSKSEHSIAKACGVSERTVRAWIEEIENDLKQNEEVKQLLRTISGARS